MVEILSKICDVIKNTHFLGGPFTINGHLVYNAQQFSIYLVFLC